MNRKKTTAIKNSLVENLDIKELADREAKIKITGNGEAVLLGCSGVCDYTDHSISFVTGDSTVTINGLDLELLSLEGDEAVVKGNFLSLVFN